MSAKSRNSRTNYDKFRGERKWKFKRIEPTLPPEELRCNLRGTAELALQRPELIVIDDLQSDQNRNPEYVFRKYQEYFKESSTNC